MLHTPTECTVQEIFHQKCAIVSSFTRKLQLIVRLVDSNRFVIDMSSPAMPYVGSRISLISKSEIRYEGILYVINTEESTIALQNVRSYGTEGRTKPDVPPTDEVYDFIIFRGEDIKDLTVLEGTATKPSQRAVLDDPAVVSVGPERKITHQRPQTARESSNREQRGTNNSRDNYPDRYGRTQNRPDRKWDDAGQNRSERKWEDSGKIRSDRKWEDRRDSRNVYPRDSHRHDGHHQGRDWKDGSTYRGHGKNGQRRSHHTGDKGPIGELVANENAQLKAEIGNEEFDFSSANEKFAKPSETVMDNTGQDTRAGYSKTKSFFDDISCDALDRSTGKEGARFDRSARDKQRELDKETFGASALNRPFGFGGQRRFQKGGKGRAF